MRSLLCTIATCSLLLFAPESTRASCYSDTIRACKKSYSATRKRCKTERKNARPICKATRKEQNRLCKEKRKQAVCTRQKRTAEQKAACLQKKTKALQSCTKPDDDPGCAQAVKRCKQNCMRNCKVCTPKGISPCVEACTETQRLCKHKAQDRYIQCTRKATDLERACKNDQKIEAYKEHYDCMKKRLVTYLRCSYRAWGGQSNCYRRASDDYRTCARKNSADYRSCTKKARLTCASK